MPGPAARRAEAAGVEGAVEGAVAVAASPDWLDRLNHLLESGLGSAILVAAAATSMVLANCRRTRAPWLALWLAVVGPRLGAHALTLRGWVNEGVMALFFFYVGLEIKKELAEGSLASPRKALLPCIAALGGMLVPMLVYLATNAALPGGSIDGITIPMATDIAFAMGIFGFFRSHMPAAAEPFLLTLATVDDLGAIMVIAVCFAGHLAPRFLLGAAACLAACLGWDRWGSQCVSASSIAGPGLLLWYCLLRGGLSADIAGFLIALCVPLRSRGGDEVVRRLIRRWAPVCALLVLPLFSLANCAVPLGGVAPSQGSLAVPLGIGLGLVVGKPLGIFSFSYLAAKAGIADMPRGMTKRHLGILGVLGAIGFTMCLFLIEHSLAGPAADLSKLAMLSASLFAAGLAGGLMAALPVQHRAVDDRIELLSA